MVNIIMKIKILVIILLVSNMMLYSDTTSDPADYSFVLQYVAIDPSTDIYYGLELPWHNVSTEYLSNLKWNNQYYFFNDRLDRHNITKNINNLPFFPLVFLPHGDIQLTLGTSLHRSNFDVGTLFTHDNITNSGFSLTAGIGSNQTTGLYSHIQTTIPLLEERRLFLINNFLFNTSAPQSAAYYSLNQTDPNSFVSMINSVLRSLDIEYTHFMDVGFDLISGAGYRIPFIELETMALIELSYSFLYLKYNTNSIEYFNRNNLGVNLIAAFNWNLLTRTETINEGNRISGLFKFYLPTTIGLPNDRFRFTSKLEHQFHYKIFREFGIRTRFNLLANYNASSDFGDMNLVRGICRSEVTGWFGVFGTIEGFIPLIDVDLKSALDLNFTRATKFVMHLALFVDGGFAIENYNYHLINYYERYNRTQIKNSLNKNDPLGQTNIGYNNYILPIVTAGAGIRIYPFFLHFILRVDVSVNILKAAVYQDPAEIVGLTISFSDYF